MLFRSYIKNLNVLLDDIGLELFEDKNKTKRIRNGNSRQYLYIYNFTCKSSVDKKTIDDVKINIKPFEFILSIFNGDYIKQTQFINND